MAVVVFLVLGAVYNNDWVGPWLRWPAALAFGCLAYGLVLGARYLVGRMHGRVQGRKLDGLLPRDWAWFVAFFVGIFVVWPLDEDMAGVGVWRGLIFYLHRTALVAMILGVFVAAFFLVSWVYRRVKHKDLDI